MPNIETNRRDSPFEALVHKKLISVLIELQPDEREYVLIKALIVCDPGTIYRNPRSTVILLMHRELFDLP